MRAARSAQYRPVRRDSRLGCGGAERPNPMSVRWADVASHRDGVRCFQCSETLRNLLHGLYAP
jgi:hypothetical protein